jgi:hypothetical protein
MKTLTLALALALAGCGRDYEEEKELTVVPAEESLALTFPVPVPPIDLPPIEVPPIVIDIDDEADDHRCNREEYARKLWNHSTKWRRYHKRDGGNGMRICWTIKGRKSNHKQYYCLGDN